MNINGEDHGEELSADDLNHLNRLLEQLHQADYKILGSIVLNIYKPGSQHVDRVERQYIDSPPSPLSFRSNLFASSSEASLKKEGGFKEREGMREGYSDSQIAKAIEAICGGGKALDTKQKWAGVHWLLRWECNFPARAKDFCERIACLPLRKDLAYKCDYRNIREISTLSFLNEDPRQMEKVRYSKNDEAMFLQLREVVQALQKELCKTETE